nr:phosphoserine phosphatase, chloroplastic [Tanacetum cinerariifolium]
MILENVNNNVGELVDSIVCTDEGIDELAMFCGVGKAIAEWTTSAIDGPDPFEEALAAKLGLFKPSLARVQDFLQKRPQRSRTRVEVLRMLRWTCGKTLLDMIPNRVYRAQLEVESIINKITKVRLRWFGHVRRRPQSAPVRRVEALVVDELRRRGRPKLRWEDRVKHDMKELLLSEDMTSDRNE